MFTYKAVNFALVMKDQSHWTPDLEVLVGIGEIVQLICKSIHDRHHLGTNSVHSRIIDERIFQKLLLPNKRIEEFQASRDKILLEFQLFVRQEEQVRGESPVLKLIQLN